MANKLSYYIQYFFEKLYSFFW